MNRSERKTQEVVFRASNPGRRILFIVGCAILGLTFSVAAELVLYRNTFDAGGDNVNLGADATNPTTFFNNTGGTKASVLFDGTYTNVGDALAAVTHAQFTTPGGNNWARMYSRPTAFAEVLDRLNKLGPGTYDLTHTVDMAETGPAVASNYARTTVRLDGQGAAGTGQWSLVNNNAWRSPEDETYFYHRSWTGEFIVTDQVKAPGDYAANEFLTGSFSQLYVQYARHAGHSSLDGILKLDNLTFSSVTIPEPTSLALLGLGGLLLIRRRSPLAARAS